MRRTLLIIAAVSIISLVVAACQKEDEKKTNEIYYQLDKRLGVDSNGNEVLRYEYKYDENGNIIWERWIDDNFNVTNDNTYDNQGRMIKQLSYSEEDNKHELDYIEELIYGPNYRILYGKSADGTVFQKDSIVLDDKGHTIQRNVFYPDSETGELYQDYVADITNDQYGNPVKTVILCPYDPDYYFEQVIAYEYKIIDKWNQYTSKEVKYSWDGENFLWDSRVVYEYDEYGNSIHEMTYSADDYDNLQLSYEDKMTVDLSLFTSHTYGTDYVPTQPNCYTSLQRYDASGKLIRTETHTYSEHHRIASN